MCIQWHLGNACTEVHRVQGEHAATAVYEPIIATALENVCSSMSPMAGRRC